MKTGARIALMAGLAGLIALLVWQGVGDVAGVLVTAGWGLLVVTVFHLLPMLTSTLGWRLLLPPADRPALIRLLAARWIGESVNGLLPVAQIGGEFAKARWIMHEGVPGSIAGASVVVETTITAMTQILFTLIGLVTLLFYLQHSMPLVIAISLGTVVIAVLLFIFYSAQRQSLFEKTAHLVEKIAGGAAWISLSGGAVKLDMAIVGLYRHKKALAAASAWRLCSWLIGTGEVWLMMYFIGLPISWPDALMLESLGQGIRAAGFLVPGSLGIQEGGYLLLGAVLGIPPQTALALSLGKRVRELALGVPGLIVWQMGTGKRLWQRRQVAQATESGHL